MKNNFIYKFIKQRKIHKSNQQNIEKVFSDITLQSKTNEESNVHLAYAVNDNILSAPCYYTLLCGITLEELNSGVFSEKNTMIIENFNLKNKMETENQWLDVVETALGEEKIGSILYTHKNIIPIITKEKRADRYISDATLNTLINRLVKTIIEDDVQHLALSYWDFCDKVDSQNKFVGLLTDKLEQFNDEFYITVYM